MDLASLVARLGFRVDAKPLDTVRERLEGIEHRLSALGTVELVRGIMEMSERFSGFAAQLSNTAAASGLSVEGLQGLQFAAAQSGSSAEAVGSSMDRLTKLLYAARQGGEEASEAFAQVGISSGQIAGFKTSADALGALSDKIKNISDPIERQAVAMKLLGGAGAQMVPFLAQGSEAMREAAGEAAAMGAILSGDNVRALQEVEDALSELWQVAKVFSATLASYFAPSVKGVVHALLDFYRANQALIKTSLKQWAENLMYVLGYVYGVVEGVTTQFLAFAAAHPVLMRVAGGLMLALAGVAGAAWAINKGIGLASSAMGIFSAVVRGVGAMVGLFTSPVALIVAGIVALTLAAQAAYAMLFQGAKFEDTWLGKLYEGSKGLAKKGLNWLLGDTPATPERQAPGGALAQGGLPQALGNMQSLTALPAGASPQMLGAPPQAPSVGDQNNYVTAPVTINVPAGTSPTDVSQAVKDGMREHLDRLSRETQRATRTAQVY